MTDTPDRTAIDLRRWFAIDAEESKGVILNPLDRFIWDHEPVGSEAATRFRRQLSDLIKWVRQQ